MLNKHRLPLALLLPFSLIACAPSTIATAPIAVSEYCLIAKGISYSEAHTAIVGHPETADVESVLNKYDTADTVKQVKDHDLAYERLCPEGTK